MKNNDFTPHINANRGDFAKTVLMPGDPHRSRFIAENFLSNAVLVNDVRGVQGYTGFFNGNKISVMASGMGMPSIGIYSYELFNFFDVKNIIRVGSAGAISEKVHLRDIVIAQAACSDSAFVNQYMLNGSFAPIADFGLLEKSVANARKKSVNFHVGNIFSTDIFYSDLVNAQENLKPVNAWGKMGVLAVEMEAAALYMNAARYGKKALAICTVSDSLVTGESTTASERETSFTDMIEIALKTATE